MDKEITFTYKQLLIIALILIAIVGIVFFFNKGTSTKSFDIKGTYSTDETSYSWGTRIEFLGNGLCKMGSSTNGTYTQSGNYIRVEYEWIDTYYKETKKSYINFTILDENTLEVENFPYKFYKQK